jgi:hypothetical protein
MATRPYTIEQPSAGVTIFTWDLLTETDSDGAPVQVPYHTDKTFQVESAGGGGFGTGGACDLEGTLYTDNTNFRVLADPQGGDISIATADKHVEAVLENMFSYRPKISTGTGVNLQAKLMCVARKT